MRSSRLVRSLLSLPLGVSSVLVLQSACSDRSEPTGLDPSWGIVAPPNVPPGPPNDAGKPVTIAFVSAPSVVQPGGSVTLEVRISDKKGNPLAGKTVEWSSSNGGTFNPVQSQSNGSGIASTSFTASATGGTQHVVTATTGTQSVSTTIGVTDLSAVIGNSLVAITRADACGRADGRLCESLVGNVVADAMRMTYGTDFSVTNSGLLRADLTCPTIDDATDYCPGFTPPPFPITHGQVLSVLQFSNRVVTLTINGAELKTILENSVTSVPSADGRFAQVSGLCFSYDIAAAAGSRVTGVVRQVTNGGCTGTPVDLTSSSTYTLAENDFMSAGGDGYADFSARATVRQLMDVVVASYVAANSPLSPAIQGRIVCTTSGATICPAAP